MTKHLRFLIVLLMTLVWSTGGAQTTIDFTKVTWNSGYTEKPYTFKADKSNGSASPTQNTTAKDIRLYAKNKLTVSTTGKKIVKIVFKISTAGKKQWAELTATTGSVVADKANSIATWENVEGATSVTFTVGDKCKYGTADKTKAGQFYFNSVDIYELSAEPGKTSTTLTFPKQSLTYATTETDDLKSFTGQTATLTADGTELTGKTITYSKTGDEIFSSFDATNGTLALNGKAGTAKITATFAGDDTYAAASAEYTLNVIDPNKTDVTFDFTDPSNFGYSGSTSDVIVLDEGAKLTEQGFVLENVQHGKNTTRLHDGYLKSYSSDKNHSAKGKISLSAPAGCVINRIVFTDKSTSPVSNLTFSIGKLNSKTWEGLAKALTMEVAQAQVFIQKMTIYFVKDTETITLNETATNNTIVAKTGVNVTLKRTMAKGVWNTICLPFDVTYDDAKAAFGNDVKIAELDGSSTGTTLSFKNANNTGIKAAKPYLIKPSIAYPAEGYVFKNVTIASDKIVPEEVSTDDSSFGFVGIYNKTDIYTGIDNTIFSGEFYAAFLGANNTVYKANPVKEPGKETKGFRAYFAIPNGTATSALRVNIDGTATSIKSINSEVVESNAPVYNLQGQRVDGNNLTPGIYVKAGKKFVVK